MSKNWVRLQVESVEVAVDSDESLLFSTVQSVVPGAHGLYYREGGLRKALSFDTNTGRVLPPTAGWDAQNIYVHLAHGSKHGAHYADYNKASQQFEKNISAVQRLIASAGLTYGMRPLSQKGPRSRSKVKSGFEAQPENVHISDESDTHVISQSSDKLDKQVLINHNEEMKLQLKEAKRDVSELKKEIESLKRSSTGEMYSAPVVDNNRNEEFERLRARNSELESLLAARKESETAEVSSSERKGSVSDDKMEMLEAIQAEQADLIRNKDDHIHSLCLQIEEAKNKLQEHTDKEEEMNNLHALIEDLREKLSSSQKERTEIDSSLGEKDELLKNAKDKIAYLENQVNILNGSELVVERTVNHGSVSPRPRSRNTSESHEDASRSQVRALETKLQLSNSALRNCEQDKQKLQEANWYANERVAKLEKENGYLKGTNEEMRIRLQESSNGGALAEKDRLICELSDQRAKLEWRLGELSQWWNDAKWKVGELESNVAHHRYLLDTAQTKIQSLNDHTPQAPSTSFNPMYSVRQNYGQWQLANTAVPMIVAEPTPFATHPMMNYLPPVNTKADTRRVILEIPVNDQKDVFVLSSVMNWQCALRCDIQREGKVGVVMDMPRGRHEFRFLTGETWSTSPHYPTVSNGFGGYNNVVIVE